MQTQIPSAPVEHGLTRSESKLCTIVDTVQNGFMFKENEIELKGSLRRAALESFSRLDSADEKTLKSLLNVSEKDGILKLNPRMVCLTLGHASSFAQDTFELFGSYHITFRRGAQFASSGIEVAYAEAGNPEDVAKRIHSASCVDEIYQELGRIQHGDSQLEREWRVLWTAAIKHDRLVFQRSEILRIRVLSENERKRVLDECPGLTEEQVAVEPGKEPDTSIDELSKIWSLK